MVAIVVSSKPVGAIDHLQQEWQTLYQHSSPNPFLNWDWISSYFRHANCGQLIFIKAELGDELVGAGFVVLQKKRMTVSAHLNRYGSAVHDQPWVEYNDFLLHKTHAQRARVALVEHCINHLKWDEFIVGASIKQALSVYALFELQNETKWYSHTYQTNLAKFSDGNAYLSSLSRNTRYQINRSIREYEKYGILNVSVAASADEALQWFEEAAPHHITRWKNTDVGSGFTNPLFVEFHHNLIRAAFDKGRIDMIKVSAGPKVISYLYNFKEGKNVYFYLSANVYDEVLVHTKPGLVGHYLTQCHYIAAGITLYDFMGGESQYKRSLSNQSMPLIIDSFKRRSLTNRVVKRLKAFKQRINTRPHEITWQDKELIVTGGSINSGNSPKYNKALAVKLTISGNGDITEQQRLCYQSSPPEQSAATNILFKSGHLQGNSLYVTTETEVLEIDINTMCVRNQHTNPRFNDLHHVLPLGDSLYIANTGLDCVDILNTATGIIRSESIVAGSVAREGRGKDWRALSSTKPHLAHPNFCFLRDNEVWVTRCDFMDAVCISDPSKKLFIGDGLVHDGVVTDKFMYFTTVNGRIKVFDKNTLTLTSEVDLAIIAPQWNGWFRGITPVASGQVLVGMSQTRSSKRRSHSPQQSMLLLVDVFTAQVIQTWPVGKLGLDAVFSVLEVPKR
ncbi:GNAT family N-acetyltransferase [Alteromonas gilva]|uniref:GNAT family N-acetyltransferase n=1 Tax=Alteromonas gilva TaxID=2987522 RepID=A0ABT5L1R9_9ALTE|nr:GNAT family N-acetyltransferase [Alteromonas gilva]MDC8830346.1 GNAT family N-acetyltransferase [Alteromonas gilva]